MRCGSWCCRRKDGFTCICLSGSIWSTPRSVIGHFDRIAIWFTTGILQSWSRA